MIELTDDALVVTDPAVHAAARTSIEFQRTLRIPDDGRDHPLPAGLGRFPLRHVDDHASRVPEAWRTRGGVMLPMWRTEALWLRFGPAAYPYAVKVGAGKRCAITGEAFTMELHDDPQDYLVVPTQPWLDGFAVEAGRIRQFVAMTLGSGYTVEEQLSGEAEWGGLQLVTHPMTADRWEAHRAAQADAARYLRAAPPTPMASAPTGATMGMAAGGLMRQEVRPDPHGLDAWDTSARSRTFVHLCDAQVWRHVTGAEPPTVPPTAAEYEAAGIGWFELAGHGDGVGGGPGLAGVSSVTEIGAAQGDVPLPDNTSVEPGTVIPLGPDLVEDGDW